MTDTPAGIQPATDVTQARAVRAAQTSVRLLRLLFADQPFAVRLWDGRHYEFNPAQHSPFTLVLRHPGALRCMLLGSDELTVSEAYLYDDVDVEGDLGALIESAERLFVEPLAPLARLRVAKALLSLPRLRRPRIGRQPARLRGRRHSRQRDRAAIAYHYDVSNAFFSLWLDRNLVYSCAYFRQADDDLDRAQVQKLDHICRKLRLQPGDRLLDIGCGWGSLVMHAVLHYRVNAIGVTLSERQVEFANARIEHAGLSDRCRIRCIDYRELAAEEPFDRIASVGMFEHVGESRLAEYFHNVWALLRPGGTFLNHAIAFATPQPGRRGNTFFDRYVFPDGGLITLSSALAAAEAVGLEIRDVESLREHYEMTLRRWIARLEERHDDAVDLSDEATYRSWRLYMSLGAHQFRFARTTIYQTLMCKPVDGASGLPPTRDDWYVDR